MKKLLSILALLISATLMGQTTLTPYTRVAGDYIRPGGSFQHWGTSDWGQFNATPTIPNGNATPMDFYMRLNWVDIESTTTQGTYSWTIFDQQFNKAMDSGARVWVAVMGMCSACGLPNFGYPTYLHNLMQAEAANSRDWQTAQGVWVPNWNSPNYIARSIALWRAVLTHMQTTTHGGKLQILAFYNWDIRYYGDFGEGHTYPWTGTEPTGRTCTTATFNLLCDSTAQVFNTAQITFPFAYQDNGHNSVIPLAAGYHILTKANSYNLFGLRRDNYGDDGYNAWISQSPDSFNPGDSVHHFNYIMLNRYKFAPWTGEPANDLNGTSRCGTVQCDLNNEINLLHATGVGNGNYPVATNNATWGANMVTNIRNGDIILGNKLVIDTTRTTTNPSTGGSWNIGTWWKNLNVAPIYENKWKVIYELRRTSDQAVMWRDTSKFKPYLFLQQSTDSIFTDNFLLTGVAASTCDLHVWIKDSTGYRPPYPLANTGRQADGSYILRTNISITTSSVPTANAGPDQVIGLPTSSVTLDGSLSSGAITSYSWTRISGPNTPTIATPTTVTTSVTGLIQGTYVFQLAINGGSSGSLIDQVTITVNASLPVANAGPDQNITLPTTTVTLNGTASTGSPASYTWSFISGPSTPSITSSSSSITGVTGLTAAGVYVFQLAVTGGSTDQVNIVVNGLPVASTTIFSVQTPSASTGGPDVAGGIELGIKFNSSRNGFIIGVRFYKTAGLTGTHTGELYSSTGTRLAQAVYTGETSTGWQQVLFSAPVPVTAGTTYVAAMYSSGGLYVNDEFGLTNQVVNSPLTGLADGASGPNGLFDYSSTTPVFPVSSFHSTNYWVDAIFSSSSGSCGCHSRSAGSITGLH